MPRPVFLLTLLLFLLPALPSLAQDKTESFDLGGDRTALSNVPEVKF